MKKRISVITVTYNALEALRRTMASVDGQDYADIEIIVVDGASSDGTADYLNTLTTRHPMQWVSEPDRGIYDAMNKGVGMATGHYCIFMNAADTFADSHTVTRVIGQGMDTDVVYGDIMKDGQLVTARQPRNCHKMYYCHQSAFYSRQALQAFPFDITHRMSADFKQAKQLFLAGRTFSHIAVPVAIFDTNGVSNTRRSKGLWDNIRVIAEVDSLKDKMRFLPRIFFTYLLCKLRGK